MKERIFSVTGRIRRTTFWVRWLIIIVVAYVFIYLMKEVISNLGYDPNSKGDGMVMLPFSVIITVITILLPIQLIKRMHDLNKSGWYGIIPIYNIILAFTEGTVGPNDYGADPKDRTNGINDQEIEMDEQLITSEAQTTVDKVVENNSDPEILQPYSIGIRFDINKVDDSLCGYGEACWRIFWQAVDIEFLAGAILSDGDTDATPDRENVYCLSITWNTSGRATEVQKLLEEFAP